MRRVPILTLLACTGSFAGCTGFGVGVRQDKEDRDALSATLATKRPEARFPAGVLLDRAWTRLFVFRPGAETQPIEDRLGVPFPFSEEATPTSGVYLVFLDGEKVVSAFTFLGPRGVDAGCLRATRGPLVPRTELALVSRKRADAAGVSLSTVAAIGSCG